MSDSKLTHKMILKPQSAHTACGLFIIAWYPMSAMAMGEDAGQEQFKVTVGKSFNCPKCKERVKDGSTTD